MVDNDENSAEYIIRPQPSHRSFRFESNTKNGNGSKYTCTQTIKERLDSMLTWKTRNGKNHGSPLTPNYHYVKEYNKEHRANTQKCIP